MLDKFDYEEPACVLCGGSDFYYPKADSPLGRIPVRRIIEKADSLFDKNDYLEAGRLLEYWRSEAIALRDREGELAIVDELVGYYRKQNDSEKGLAAITRALELTDALEQSELASGATVLVNCATAYKAFGMAEKALPLYERAEDIYKKVLKPGDARFGGLYNNMALALADLSRFSDAETAYFSALDIMIARDDGQPECAITYINLAHLYERSGERDKIAVCLENAYDLLTGEAIEKGGYYAFVLEKCAPSFAHFGQVEIYEKMTKESAEIYARNRDI